MTKVSFKILLMLGISLNVALANEGKAQVKSVREVEIDINLVNTSLKDVFKEIERKTKYYFSFSKEKIDIRQEINISSEGATMEEVLLEISRLAHLKFRQINNNIGVQPMPESEAARTEVEIVEPFPTSGKVTDEQGNGLPGASVLIKGTTDGTITDVDGNFTINVNEGDILVVSFVGYVSWEVSIRDGTAINIQLEPDVSALEEVVVIGYGTQKREEVTSSVASVKESEFVKGNVIDAGQLLQGKVAGLTVSNPSGDPTGNTQILLRGNTTILGGNQSPLVLVDGVPGDFKLVAPEDIVSIDVLKDGSAAAIYGTRGTNGVILITTRKATGDYTNRVDYSASFSTQQITRKLDMLSAEDYRRQIADGTRDVSQDLGASTDWLDEITKTPFTQIHNISFRGGSSTTNYLVTGNIRDLRGIFIKSENRIYTGRMDINHNMFDNKLRLNMGLLSRTVRYSTTGDGYSFNGYTYRQALIRNPTAPVKNEDGTWNENVGNFNYENPVARLKESDGVNRTQNTRLNGTATFEPITGLQFKALFSYNQYNETRGYAETKNHISTLRDGRNGFASNGTRETEERLIELTTQYSRELPDHSFSVLGGYGYQDRYIRDFWMQNWDFPTDEFSYHNIALGNALAEGLAKMGGSTTSTNLISFFGRTTYGYKDRYLLMGSLRYEAASQLYGADDPWGLFPAISGGWRISNEPFLSGIGIINDLKIRAGYGVTGTPNSDGFGAVALLGYGSPFYYEGEWIRTLVPSQNPNPDLKWEEKHETNLGLDFSLFESRVSGTLDLYKRRIEDLLYDYSVPTPPNLYPTTRANVGVMENKGVEIILNVTPISSSDFDWTTTFIFSTNTNKLVSLSNDLYETTNDYFTTGYTGEPIQTHTHIVEVGEKIGNFHGFKVVDIDEDGQWIYETADGESATYDEFNYAFDDKMVLGNGLPRYYGGWNNSVRFKNFDLNMTMRGAFGYQLLNFERMYLENPTITNYNRLKSSDDLVFGKAILASPLEYNSYYIEDADFWKIDNITIGYNLSMSGSKYLRSARISLSALNTFLFTGYKGIDPEVNRLGLDPGNDERDKYPTTRSYTIGFSVSF